MTAFRSFAALVFAACATAASSLALAAAPVDSRLAVLEAMKSELARSQHELKLKGHEAPYFIAYEVKDEASQEVAGRFGSLFLDGERRTRRAHVDVRVGDYDFDSSGPNEMFDFDAVDSGYSPQRELPLDDDPASIRGALWLVTDETYKKALSSYLKKRGKEVYRAEESDRAPSFSKEPPQKRIDAPLPAPFARERWAAIVRRLTSQLRTHPEFYDSMMRVTVDKTVRWLASTEGAELVTESAIYGIHVQAFARAPDGMFLENGRDYYASTEAGLPNETRLAAESQQMSSELIALQKAPAIDPYTGPALLEPQATGVFFHEAVGHRLEGERQNDDKEGRTFKGQVGHAVLPAFLSVIDDPTLEAVDGEPLNGHYAFDDQGVPAQRTPLVVDGVLKTYLMSRAPVKGFSRSNGHGRAAGNREPVARMANTVVESKNQLDDAELRRQLVELAKKQGKPYALLIKDVTGGNTNTSGFDYQAFKGQPRLVTRIDVATGKEELVRGVEIVGTPLTTINKIVATGKKRGVFNGYCGAESGYVPVSTVAPAALIAEVELQRKREENGRPPLLPAPWATPAAATAASPR